MPRILILSASVGAGHLRAAQAVEKAAKELLPDATVENIDVLTLTNAAFRRVYGKAYLDFVNKAPHVLGYFYDLMDQPSRSGKNRTDRLIYAVEKLNLRPFLELLREGEWDLVINTHFMPARIVAGPRKAGQLDVPQVTVTTDFETHRLWVNSPCEHYFTATEEGARYLESFGVPAGHATATGIPIDPVFATRKDRGELLRKHGLAGDRPIVLQLAGGFGVGPIGKIHKALLEVERPVELITVCGKNEESRCGVEEIACPSRHRRHVLGFTTEMDELMAVADLVVSKPGGLTTSEALARGAAMVIVNPIPGQESRNSDFLLENGAAIKANNVATLGHKVGKLLADEDRLRTLRANAKALGRPRAAFEVVERALSFAAVSVG
jgi:processive 1,2-diacylglycerol beta-glucosyltransferase